MIDFIFGGVIVVFEDCCVYLKVDLYVMVVLMLVDEFFGFVFFDCELIVDFDVFEVYFGWLWWNYV